jgi:hypothetical protein
MVKHLVILPSMLPMSAMNNTRNGLFYSKRYQVDERQNFDQGNYNVSANLVWLL